ncbi:MAG TPA: DUF4372 domain-containing protein, partial [Rhodopila sp.]
MAHTRPLGRTPWRWRLRPDFSFKSQLVAMLYAQFAGAASLREIEAALQSHANRLYNLGAAPARR